MSLGCSCPASTTLLGQSLPAMEFKLELIHWCPNNAPECQSYFLTVKNLPQNTDYSKLHRKTYQNTGLIYGTNITSLHQSHSPHSPRYTCRTPAPGQSPPRMPLPPVGGSRCHNGPVLPPRHGPNHRRAGGACGRLRPTPDPMSCLENIKG